MACMCTCIDDDVHFPTLLKCFGHPHTALMCCRHVAAGNIHPPHLLIFLQFVFSTAVLLSLCSLSHFIPPPTYLPDIFPVLISACSCALFILFLLYLNWLQLFGTSITTSIGLTKSSEGSQLYQKVGRSSINLTLFNHPTEKEHTD